MRKQTFFAMTNLYWKIYLGQITMLASQMEGIIFLKQADSIWMKLAIYRKVGLRNISVIKACFGSNFFFKKMEK